MQKRAIRAGLTALSLILIPAMEMASGRQASAPRAWVSNQMTGAPTINDAFSRIMDANPDLGRAVSDLEHGTQVAGSPWEAAQLLATAYEVVGRYADARAIRDAHRKTTPQCVFSGDAWPNALRRLPNVVSVLLINEDHLDASTRANVLAALPTLRSLGFTDVAMEALPNDSVANEVSAGEVPDEAASGVYLREPVAAALVGEAVRLGFHLHAYDADEDFDVRERLQARRLLDIARKARGRVIVIAGPGHVQLDGDWMGNLLAHELGSKLYSIDQVSGSGTACERPAVARLITRHRDQPGHLMAMKTDAALISPAVAGKADERSSEASWLNLGKVRTPMLVATQQVCPGSPPRCLISARRQDGAPTSVPEDRYLTRGIWRGYLFVRPGTYTVTGVDESGHSHAVTLVAPSPHVDEQCGEQHERPQPKHDAGCPDPNLK